MSAEMHLPDYVVAADVLTGWATHLEGAIDSGMIAGDQVAPARAQAEGVRRVAATLQEFAEVAAGRARARGGPS